MLSWAREAGLAQKPLWRLHLALSPAGLLRGSWGSLVWRTLAPSVP